MVINVSIYESLSTESKTALIKICTDVYGDRVWFKKSKRVIKEMAYNDLLDLAFKIENERFVMGVPFMPKPIIPMVDFKLIPKDAEGKYLYMGKATLNDAVLPIVLRAANTAELNRKIGQINTHIQSLDDQEKTAYLKDMLDRYNVIKETIANLKEEAKLLREIHREEWLNKVAASTEAWLSKCASAAFEIASKEHYRINIRKRYTSLLTMI